MYLYAVKGADSLYLDRYEAVPAVSGARPCMIFVFGGGFVDGTRDDARYVPFFEYMAAKGITVVSIDYRLGLREVIASGGFLGRACGRDLYADGRHGDRRPL